MTAQLVTAISLPSTLLTPSHSHDDHVLCSVGHTVSRACACSLLKQNHRQWQTSLKCPSVSNLPFTVCSLEEERVVGVGWGECTEHADPCLHETGLSGLLSEPRTQITSLTALLPGCYALTRKKTLGKEKGNDVATLLTVVTLHKRKTKRKKINLLFFF